MRELARVEPAEMERAYLEYRRGCYRLVHRDAHERRLLDVLAEPKSVGDLIAELGFPADRAPGVELLLDALARYGAVVATADRPRRFQAVDGFSDDGEPDRARLALALGGDRVEDLLHARSFGGLIGALYGDDDPVKVNFESSRELWGEFLDMPFYRFWRQRAVATVSSEGATVLDLACGPGLGLLELAEVVGPAGSVLGLELSRDFVCQAVERTAGRRQVRVAQADLDDGLGFLGDRHFDGALLVGALHYLRERERLFADIARVLKPGGRFCVALAHTHRESYDQELMALRLSLRQPPASPCTRDELLGLGARHGFAPDPEESAMGCYSWAVFVRAR